MSNNGYSQASSLNGSNISSGTVPNDRLPAAISGDKIGSGINASNITTGQIGSDRLPSEITGKTNIESDSAVIDNLTVNKITVNSSEGGGGVESS